MTRITGPVALDSNSTFALLIGPTDSTLSDEQLEQLWRFYGAQLMAENPGVLGTRPWGWWAFEAREERPNDAHAQGLRLAELGAFSRDELAAIRERANEARMRVGTWWEHISAPGTDAERFPDREAVELQERIEAERRGA